MQFRNIGLLAVALVAAGTAQPTDQWARLNTLEPGAEIRVALADGRTLRGFLQSAAPDSLVMNATTSQEKLSRADIKRIQLKRPGHRGRNTLIGLAIGAGGGLGVGAGLDHAANDNWFPNLGKAVFAPVGAIIGTVIGVALPTGGWREIYRSP